jgi:hypothetical protein
VVDPILQFETRAVVEEELDHAEVSTADCLMQRRGMGVGTLGAGTCCTGC